MKVSIRVESPKGVIYTGSVEKFFDGFKIDLRKDRRVCLLPAVRDCEYSEFELAIDELMDAIMSRLKWEKEKA